MNPHARAAARVVPWARRLALAWLGCGFVTRPNREETLAAASCSTTNSQPPCLGSSPGQNNGREPTGARLYKGPCPHTRVSSLLGASPSPAVTFSLSSSCSAASQTRASACTEDSGSRPPELIPSSVPYSG